MKRWLFGLFLTSMSLFVHADDAALNSTLVRVINQLNAVLPLLDEAADEVAPDTRLQLHIHSFEGADGIKHPGVRDDLLAIRNALIDYINKPAIEPKTVKPLALDFVGK